MAKSYCYCLLLKISKLHVNIFIWIDRAKNEEQRDKSVKYLVHKQKDLILILQNLCKKPARCSSSVYLQSQCRAVETGISLRFAGQTTPLRSKLPASGRHVSNTRLLAPKGYYPRLPLSKINQKKAVHL